MLHDILARYLQDIEAAIRNTEGGHIERYEEEILGSNRINVRIRIRFENGPLLELNEAVIVEADQIQHLGYRYHLQDGENRLVFRYDNTPHFPHLESAPHHKHLPSGVVPSQQPSIPQIVEEIKALTR